MKVGLSSISVCSCVPYRTTLRGGFDGEGEVGDDRRLIDKLPIQQKPVFPPLQSTRTSGRTLNSRECERTPSWDLSYSMPSAYRCPHSTCHPLAPVQDPANLGQPFPHAAHYRCHFHCRYHHGSVPAPVEAFVLLLEATLEVGEDHLGSCRQKRRRCFREASLRHVHRMSRLTEAMRDVLAVVAAAAAAVVAAAAAAVAVAAAVAAAAEEEDSKDWDPVAGKELIDKKSQMMQVK